MSVAVRARPTSTRRSYPLRFTLHFRRTTPRRVLAEIASKYGAFIAPEAGTDDGEDLIRIEDSDWYKDMERIMTPGKYLKTLREASGLTQAELGKKIGTSAARTCDYEAGRRQISKAVARRLAGVFLVSVDRFI